MQSFCFNLKCNYIAEEVMDICPKCGKKMRTTQQVKRTGWLQLFCGIFLAGMMSVVIYKIGPFMLQRLSSDGPVKRFTGTAEQAFFFLGLLGIVWIFGMINIIIGLFHIKTGRRNKLMTSLILILGLVLYGFAGWLKKKYGI